MMAFRVHGEGEFRYRCLGIQREWMDDSRYLYSLYFVSALPTVYIRLRIKKID